MFLLVVFLHPTQLPGYIGGTARGIFKNNIPNIPDDLVLDFEFFLVEKGIRVLVSRFYTLLNCQGILVAVRGIKKNNILNIPDEIVLDFEFFLL